MLGRDNVTHTGRGSSSLSGKVRVGQLLHLLLELMQTVGQRKTSESTETLELSTPILKSEIHRNSFYWIRQLFVIIITVIIYVNNDNKSTNINQY